MRNLCTATEWCRPIGCLKLQVIFCKRATENRAHLRKMTYKDKASYGSSPPCTRSLELNLILISHFPQKSPTIDGSFAERDLQLEASYGSSPPCAITLELNFILISHFPQKSPMIDGSFAEKGSLLSFLTCYCCCCCRHRLGTKQNSNCQHICICMYVLYVYIHTYT